jgi:predicted nucleic acid-binding protein
MASIADTSFVVAVAIQSDARHQASLQILRQEETIYLTQPALAEIAYLLRRERGNLMVAHFLIGLQMSKYKLISLHEDDVIRTGVLLQEYADSRVDFVDASIAAIAERLKVTRILTLDYRDFLIIRPRHCDYFELLPMP